MLVSICSAALKVNRVVAVGIAYLEREKVNKKGHNSDYEACSLINETKWILPHKSTPCN